MWRASLPSGRSLALAAAWLALGACAIAGKPPEAGRATAVPAATDLPILAQSAALPAPLHPKLRVEIAVMSQCPYGVQAINALHGMAQELGSAVDVVVEYIGNLESNGELTSMHGPKEVVGDLAQICVQEIAPDKKLDLMVCQNKNYRDVATNWIPCLRELGIPEAPVRRCVESQQGAGLLAASFERSRQRGDTASPTIRIAGKPYSGNRRARAFSKAVCAELVFPHPYCAAMPVAPPVNVIVLADRRCSDCKPERYDGMLKARIENPLIRNVDYGDAEGKSLYAATSPGNLPVILFDSSLDTDPEALESFQRVLKTTGSWYVVPVGGDFNPTCQSPAECRRADCRNSLGCRTEIPNRLDVFIMSKCPFGVKALNAMDDVLQSFGSIDFRIHYIGTLDEKRGLSSMHGPSEVEEDKRQLCAIAHYPLRSTYLKYFWCRNKNIRDLAWETCTGASTGINADVLRRCAEGAEGEKLLTASFKSTSELGIGASPTWLVNNKFKHNGVDAWTIKRFLCEHNPKLKPCATLPATPPADSVPSSNAGCD